MTSEKKQKVILIVGRSGNGKRSIGNSLLGEKMFTIGTQEYSLEPVIQEKDDLKVIVCPFIGDTGDDIKYTIEEIYEATMKILYNLVRIGTPGIDAIIFALKYGVRFTNQEKEAVKRVREIFGSTVFSDVGIIAFSYGDLFNQDNNNQITQFAEWCLQQSGEVKELFEEAKYRCVLFNNKEKSKEQLEIQGNYLWHYLSNKKKENTNSVEETKNVELVKEQKQNYCSGTQVMLAGGKDDKKQEEEAKEHDIEENTQVGICKEGENKDNTYVSLAEKRDSDNSTQVDSAVRCDSDDSTKADSGVKGDTGDSTQADSGVKGDIDDSTQADSGVNGDTENSTKADSGVKGDTGDSTQADSGVKGDIDDSTQADSEVKGDTDDSTKADSGEKGDTDDSTQADSGVKGDTDDSTKADSTQADSGVKGDTDDSTQADSGVKGDTDDSTQVRFGSER
uniref:AIG1-type G domain-containing protein n=1 Tax=Biomphalaria glabrata TaxID=6526 RepID=A0A2C9LSA0_BIOGL